MFLKVLNTLFLTAIFVCVQFPDNTDGVNSGADIQHLDRIGSEKYRKNRDAPNFDMETTRDGYGNELSQSGPLIDYYSTDASQGFGPFVRGEQKERNSGMDWKYRKAMLFGIHRRLLSNIYSAPPSRIIQAEIKRNGFGSVLGSYKFGKKYSPLNSHPSGFKRVFGPVFQGYQLGRRAEKERLKRAFGQVLGIYKLGKRSSEGVFDNYPTDPWEDKRAYGNLLGGYKFGRRFTGSEYNNEYFPEKRQFGQVLGGGYKFMTGR